MAINPRALLRLNEVSIKRGSQADITLISMSEKIHVDKDYFESKSLNSPWLGNDFCGCATDVFVAGKRTLCNTKVVA